MNEQEFQSAFFKMIQQMGANTASTRCNLTLTEAYDSWIAPKILNLSEGTMSYYDKLIKHWNEYLDATGIHYVDDIDLNVVGKYVKREQSRGVSNNTIDKHVSIIKYIFSFLTKKKYINSNPLEDMKGLPMDLVETKTIDADLVEKIIKYFDTLDLDDDLNLRNSLMIHMYLDTGCRRTELNQIGINNINLDKSSIFLPHTKIKKIRYVFFTEKTKNLLIRYLNQVNPIDRLFINLKTREPLHLNAVYKILNEVKRVLNIPDNVSISPHKWRHTLATELLRSGVDLDTVRRMLGHSTLAQTQKYLHMTNTDVKLAIKEKSPLSKMG